MSVRSTDQHPVTTLAGRYRLDRVLGQGGMGVVHFAYDAVLERRVAIKVLPPDLAQDPTARARFHREALAAAALDHPFICKIHEVGEDDGRSFLVMEYIDGRTLDVVLREGGLTARDLIDVAHEIAQALDEAHRRGVVHRDLKPSNIMLTVQGHVKVLDFGLAKHVDTQATHETQSGALTDPGTRLGTPAYMSPEQVLGSPLDPRSDMFSLGAVLHELASGRHPFLKVTTPDTMAAILKDPPSSTEGDLDVVPGFGRVVHRMLAKACAERFQTMSELKATLDDLRSSRTGVTPSSGGGGLTPAHEERTPFVSRDPELGELAAAIDRMLLGQGGIVLLGGEPGVGKTRLGREAQRLAHGRGCLILTGQCYEQEGAPPFGPFIEMLESSVRALPQAVRIALGDGAAEIASIAPSLRRVYHDIPAATVVPADQQRRIVFNAYLEYMQRGSQKSASVVLFDDLHWADESSLQLLLHLAPHVRTMRVLVIGTYRDVELDTARPFAKTLETLLRQRLATKVNVKRLSAEGVERMLATMSGSAPPSSLVCVVYEETDGNPFFVEEVFHHLAEEGKIFGADGNWKADLKADQIDVPEGVRLVVARRLERLGDNARKVLTAAAVIGRSFSLDLLLAVSNESEDDVIDVIEHAERAQLLKSERSRQARYTFVHELIRSTLISAMALPRRQRVHLRVADAIERLRASSLDSHLSVLAHHLYQAGAAVDSDRAIRYLLLAASRAYDAGAFEEALELCAQLASLDLAGDSRELGQVQELRARALMSLARPREATEPAEHALALAIAHRDDVAIGRTAETLLESCVWLGTFDRGSAGLGRALTALSPDAALQRCRLQAISASWVPGEHRLETGLELIKSAAESAETLGDRPLMGYVASQAANMSRNFGRVRESIEHAARACTLLDDSQAWVKTQAAFTRLIGLFYVGDFAAIPAAIEQTTTLSTRSGNAGALWIIRRLSASLGLMQSGDLRTYRDAIEEELKFSMQWPFLARMSSAIATVHLGEDEAAREMLGRAVAEQPPKTWVDCLVQVNLFALEAWSGRSDAARAQWAELSSRVARPGQANLHGQWLSACCAAAALMLLGDRTGCAALHPAIAEFIDFGQRWDTTTLGWTMPPTAAAIAAQAGDNNDLARDLFERALAEVSTSRVHRPVTAMWFGRFLAASADVDARRRGRALLTEAVSAFQQFGMVMHGRHAQRWLSEIA